MGYVPPSPPRPRIPDYPRPELLNPVCDGGFADDVEALKWRANFEGAALVVALLVSVVVLL